MTWLLWDGPCQIKLLRVFLKPGSIERHNSCVPRYFQCSTGDSRRYSQSCVLILMFALRTNSVVAWQHGQCIHWPDIHGQQEYGEDFLAGKQQESWICSHSPAWAITCADGWQLPITALLALLQSLKRLPLRNVCKRRHNPHQRRHKSPLRLLKPECSITSHAIGNFPLWVFPWAD